MSTKEKSFLQRPEGKTAAYIIPAMVGIPLAVLTVMNLPAILAWLILVVTNIIYLGALCGGVGLFALLAADSRIRALVWYMYKAFARFSTARFVELDPIGILKSYVDDISNRLTKMRKSMDNLVGQMKVLEKQITENEADRVASLKLAGVASKDETKKRVFVLQSRQAGRLEKSNMSLKDLLTRMQKLHTNLKKMYESADFMRQDIESEVEVKSAERKALLAGYGAFKAARSILEGGGDKREMYDMALEHLADDYGMKMGEMESFMDMSQGFIDSMDLENGVFEQDALDQIEQWESRTDKLIGQNVRVVSNVEGHANHEGGFDDLLADVKSRRTL